jgi:hypothetical protein
MNMRFDEVKAGAVRLFSLSGPLCMLVMRSQAHCQVECCGPDVFAIGPELFAVWVREAGLQDAQEALRQLDDYIAEMTTLQEGGYTGKISSYDEEFNAVWTAAEWIYWFGRWRHGLDGAIALVAAESENQ